MWTRTTLGLDSKKEISSSIYHFRCEKRIELGYISPSDSDVYFSLSLFFRSWLTSVRRVSPDGIANTQCREGRKGRTSPDSLASQRHTPPVIWIHMASDRRARPRDTQLTSTPQTRACPTGSCCGFILIPFTGRLPNDAKALIQRWLGGR